MATAAANTDDLSLPEVAHRQWVEETARRRFVRWTIYQELLATGMHCTDALHEAVRRAERE